jgi:hypothetical protein
MAGCPVPSPRDRGLVVRRSLLSGLSTRRVGLTGGRWLVFSLLLLLDIAVAIQIIHLNRRAARRDLQPIREQVARLIEVLETTNSA